ncbi:Hypothetical predicted protein [Lecanosticta acicola]|uniref:SPRY domain-containing protein n=1 Tax=Lecanosticta acicola TaxID=111012 RepID=A0AAI8W1I0_9PEZI|nr:Hypothetical predicted protein [Lecanosticta acicola]
MDNKFDPPRGPPPNVRTQSQSDVERTQDQRSAQQPQSAQRVSWTVGGGPSSNRELPSNNRYRDNTPSVPAQTQQRPSSLKRPISGHQSISSGAATKAPLPHSAPVVQPSHPSDVEMSEDSFQPPPGAPSDRTAQKMEFQPSLRPPPGYKPSISPDPRAPSMEPPPYDPWVGPDDSLRPPPPIFEKSSPTANADYDDAARAHAWCTENPLWPAREHDAILIERIQEGDLRLTVPPNTTDVTQYQPALGKSYIRTMPHLGDTILLSDIPIFASFRQSPLSTGQPATIYFEVHVLGIGDRYNQNNQVESGLALGFVAPPYPAWRLPGWHRGSIGVHSDDGRRYVDNSYGGRDFVAPYKKGDVVGIGMTYSPPVHGDRVSMRCKAFFTRNGRMDGHWDLHEEEDADADAGSLVGLEGENDLLAAVGVFGSVELEAIFRSDDWLFKP